RDRDASEPRDGRSHIRGRFAQAARPAVHPGAPGIPPSSTRALRFHQRCRNPRDSAVTTNAEHRLRFAWRGLVVPAVLIAAAQIAAIATHLQSDSLAAPSEILAAGLDALSDGTVL